MKPYLFVGMGARYAGEEGKRSIERLFQSRRSVPIWKNIIPLKGELPLVRSGGWISFWTSVNHADSCTRE
jgi:hypothetical protein